MYLIRRLEDTCLDLHRQGLMRASIHLGFGQEAVAVGACSAIHPNDWIAITYRSHAQCLAKGIPSGPLLAEMLGRATGICRGKGGSMHLGDMTKGVLPANAIVGAGLPIAAGAALALQMDKKAQVVLAFHGDGATNQGAWHETMNLAAVWSLPIVFVCENNQYSEMTPIRDMIRIDRLTDRAAGYGLPAKQVDGNDVRAVHAAVLEAAERARAGEGPFFLEALTYRLGGHYQADTETYRTQEEVESWRRRDPLTVCRQALEAEGVSGTELGSTIATVEAELKEAVSWALAQPPAEPSDALRGAYVDPPAFPSPDGGG